MKWRELLIVAILIGWRNVRLISTLAVAGTTRQCAAALLPAECGVTTRATSPPEWG